MNKKNIILTHDEIQTGITSINRQLMSNINSMDNIIFLCIMNGGFMFFNDIIRHWQHYEAGLKFTINKQLPNDCAFAGKTIILVDDILDTGNTLSYFVKEVKKLKPRKILACVTLKKEPTSFNECPVFFIKSVETARTDFYAGYGMDNKQGGDRHLTYIFAVDK